MFMVAVWINNVFPRIAKAPACVFFVFSVVNGPAMALTQKTRDTHKHLVMRKTTKVRIDGGVYVGMVSQRKTVSGLDE